MQLGSPFPHPPTLPPKKKRDPNYTKLILNVFKSESDRFEFTQKLRGSNVRERRGNINE